MAKTHKLLYVLKENFHLNKHAAQAAGADPSKCNSTNRQNPPLQHNHHNSRTSNAIWIFKIYNLLETFNSLFYDWKDHLQPMSVAAL